MAAGGIHTCATTAANLLYCFGSNGAGQIGVGRAQPGAQQCFQSDVVFEYFPSPVQVTDIPYTQLVTAAEETTCALTTTHAGYCWGYNSFSEVGPVGMYGTRVLNPARTPASQPLIGISPFGSFVCALAEGTSQTDQWRVCFRWAKSHAHDVEIVDYH